MHHILYIGKLSCWWSYIAFIPCETSGLAITPFFGSLQSISQPLNLQGAVLLMGCCRSNWITHWRHTQWIYPRDCARPIPNRPICGVSTADLGCEHGYGRCPSGLCFVYALPHVSEGCLGKPIFTCLKKWAVSMLTPIAANTMANSSSFLSFSSPCKGGSTINGPDVDSWQLLKHSFHDIFQCWQLTHNLSIYRFLDTDHAPYCQPFVSRQHHLSTLETTENPLMALRTGGDEIVWK